MVISQLQVGAIRAHSSGMGKAASAVGGSAAVGCLAWHAYQPMLVAGGADGIATVYAIDSAASAGSGTKSLAASAAALFV